MLSINWHLKPPFSRLKDHHQTIKRDTWNCNSRWKQYFECSFAVYSLIHDHHQQVESPKFRLNCPPSGVIYLCQVFTATSVIFTWVWVSTKSIAQIQHAQFSVHVRDTKCSKLNLAPPSTENNFEAKVCRQLFCLFAVSLSFLTLISAPTTFRQVILSLGVFPN